MSVLEALERIRRRIAIEWFDLEPIAEPPPPRAEWPAWSHEKNTEVQLRVLTLNAWGLPVAPNCTERAIEIANAIGEDFELVVLQEIWHMRERNIIITRAQQSGFHYYHYFNPAVGFPLPLGHDAFGTGLLVLSKFPIVSALYHSFSLSGRPYALHEADFVANKGVGLLRIETPAGQIDVYVTHLLANYNYLGKPGPGDFYLPHRIGQSYELTRFISATSRNPLTIICGDFNSTSDCLELRIPRDILQIRDAFTDMNSSDGHTFATEDNKYSSGEHPMRMDYILYKTAKRATKDQLSWQLVMSDVYKGFFTDDRGERCPLSDHNGVQAEFVFGPPRPHACARAHAANGGNNVNLEHSCHTTTCIHCDGLEAATKYSSSDVSPSVQCLKDVRYALDDGRTLAIQNRMGHLRRSGYGFFGAVAIMWGRLLFLESNWWWLLLLILTLQFLLEYILAFFFLTFECSTFTEMINEVRLHLNAEQANEAVM